MGICPHQRSANESDLELVFGGGSLAKPDMAESDRRISAAIRWSKWSSTEHQSVVARAATWRRQGELCSVRLE
ncbi:hypothetical protein ICM05_06310 [Leucobacter sp. cx-42]|uniref:hypothetical protein n=1 Tax=unclassified Leucobacter TaxID=2621730 RepID=UPI00165E40FA|nr:MULTISPECIES: hypothetical protein [unclassified Leucobacter]MBC9954261.1 hypothetical protein [Leucobacter sp. cx-42]